LAPTHVSLLLDVLFYLLQMHRVLVKMCHCLYTKIFADDDTSAIKQLWRKVGRNILHVDVLTGERSLVIVACRSRLGDATSDYIYFIQVQIMQQKWNI
jgi:hypothetical protein